LLGGCGSSDKKGAEKVLKIAFTEDPGTGDVQLTTDDYGIPINIYDRLVEAVTTSPGVSELVPGLAEKWEVSDDGKVYTFYLRKGVKFHNGEELKADDVLFTFDRMLDPKTKALNTDFVDMIEGAKERMEGKADSVNGLKVVDDYIIEITLGEAFAPFLANLATPAGSIYNRKATEKAGDKFGIDVECTVGTGPFKLKNWTVNEKVTLEAFDDYFRGRSGLDEIVFKIIPDAETQRMLFETGELDVFDCDNARSQIPYFEGSDKWKNHIVMGPRVGVYYYCINEDIEPFQDVRVRKAMQLAIDREAILEKMFYGKGQVVSTIMPPGLAGYNPDAPQIPYDPQKAKELLKEAGYPNGFDMEAAQVTDSPSSLKMNEVVQSMLKEIGINMKITQMDSASFYGTRKEGKLPMYYSNWSADFNDPDNFIYTFFAPRNTVARSFNYKNEDVAEKLETARSMTNQEERYKLYQEIEQTIVIKDAAWIPLFTLQHLFVVQPKVKNFKVSWNGWSNMPYYGIEIEE
jgi:peptide/nickel transport system substrate-binding protein/oligopeptide transport system substrate-binding protein